MLDKNVASRGEEALAAICRSVRRNSAMLQRTMAGFHKRFAQLVHRVALSPQTGDELGAEFREQAKGVWKIPSQYVALVVLRLLKRV